MFTVTIKPEHTTGRSFQNRKPGALVAAARQQYPDLHLTEENSCFCQSSTGQRFDFKESDYNEVLFLQLQTKQIKQLQVTLEPNNIF